MKRGPLVLILERKEKNQLKLWPCFKTPQRTIIDKKLKERFFEDRRCFWHNMRMVYSAVMIPHELTISSKNRVSKSVYCKHNLENGGKMAKMWILFRNIDSWLAAWAGHELGGSSPQQCRWAGVVWAPRCRDCVRAVAGLVVYSLTSRFFVNCYLDHSRAWIPACSLTAALLHRSFPSNLSTTTQGAIVKLCGASSELWTLFFWSV